MQKQYKEDLEEFINLTKLSRGTLVDSKYPNEDWHLNFYQSHSLEELENFINSLQLDEKILDDYTFNYYMNVLIKYMNGCLDSHTRLAFAKVTPLPYKLKWINGSGLFIDYSLDAKIRKAKVLKINGILIDELIDEYEKSVSYATNNHLYAMIENNFNILEVLYSLPSFKRDSLFLKVETDKGILSIDTRNSLKEYHLERKDNKPNFYIQDKALIFTYQSCHPYYIPVIYSLLKMLDKEIENQNITKFVLDLRGNGGGASSIIKPLIEYLKNANLELITIVDKVVFSSGRFACIAMQMIGSKIVDEQIGTPINCFGNALRPSALTNTCQQPILAKTYWYLDDDKGKMIGINEKKELATHDKDFFKPKFLELDEEYTETLADFVNDYDIFLKNALVNHTKIK